MGGSSQLVTGDLLRKLHEVMHREGRLSVVLDGKAIRIRREVVDCGGELIRVYAPRRDVLSCRPVEFLCEFLDLRSFSFFVGVVRGSSVSILETDGSGEAPVAPKQVDRGNAGG